MANIALIDHRQDTLILPNGIDQLYATTGKQDSVFRIALPTTKSNQYWCIIRADTARQTIDYRSSRLTLRTDMLRKLVRSVAGRENK